MKSILLVCERSNIDNPLRRSLAHLVKSSQVTIAPDGFQAYRELIDTAFNLVIVDFEIPGIDSLEFIECAGYIDPDVPIVLMLKQTHRAIWSTARSLNANPILRPFKPLTFLRLVDTLLHQHLERYRDLSESLQLALNRLTAETGHSIAFLVESSGQIIMSSGRLAHISPELLGNLAAAQCASEKPSAIEQFPGETLIARHPAEKDHELHVTTVIENLHLALLSAAADDSLPHAAVWDHVEAAVGRMRLALQEISSVGEQTSQPDADAPAERFDGAALRQMTIPLKLSSEPASPPDQPQSDSDEMTVNWDIITNNVSVLDRLQSILSG